MERTAETPDSHITDLAQQFLDTAVLLRRHLPAVVAPSALRVNAAFAIELFLKSLNSHWEHHEIDGLDDGYEITTRSNVRGHELVYLFDQLPDTIRSELDSAFTSSPLSSKFSSVRDLLTLYALTFEIERYGFERRSSDNDNRPIGEIVTLAEFVGEFVINRPRIRYALE